MKKGFTLIELLAVIVILAIIALIATPIILNIINDSKAESRERSIDNIIHTARIYATKERLDVKEAVHIKDIKNMIDGEKPENGIIYFDKNGKVAFSLDFEDEMYVKSFEGDIEKENKENYLMQVKTPIEKYTSEELIETNKNEYFLTNEKNLGVSPKIKKEQIEKVITVPSNKEPSNVLGRWDVSTNQNGKVMAWYTDVDSNGLFEVYIGQTGGVKANPNSSFLFIFLINLKELDLTYLNTSDVVDMNNMFADLYSLTSIDVSNFDTSNVKNMKKLFGINVGKGLLLNKIIGLENFDTSSVENMHAMFLNCINLKEVDVSSFDTSEVRDMAFMFASAKFETDTQEFIEVMKLEKIKGIEKFSTNNVTYMNAMFNRCSNLKSLDLRNWNISNVTNIKQIFYGTTNLKTIYVGSNWDTLGTTTNLFGGSSFIKNVSEMCGPNSTNASCALN